jgi:hypothetical protein
VNRRSGLQLAFPRIRGAAFLPGAPMIPLPDASPTPCSSARASCSVWPKLPAASANASQASDQGRHRGTRRRIMPSGGSCRTTVPSPSIAGSGPRHYQSSHWTIELGLTTISRPRPPALACQGTRSARGGGFEQTCRNRSNQDFGGIGTSRPSRRAIARRWNTTSSGSISTCFTARPNPPAQAASSVCVGPLTRPGLLLRFRKALDNSGLSMVLQSLEGLPHPCLYNSV